MTVDGASAGTWLQPLGNGVAALAGRRVRAARRADRGQVGDHGHADARSPGAPAWTRRPLRRAQPGRPRSPTPSRRPQVTGLAHRRRAHATAAHLSWAGRRRRRRGGLPRVRRRSTADVRDSAAATWSARRRRPGSGTGRCPRRQTWYYRVVAVDAAGNAGPASAVVSATTRARDTQRRQRRRPDDIARLHPRRHRRRLRRAVRRLGRSARGAKWHDFFAVGGEMPLDRRLQRRRPGRRRHLHPRRRRRRVRRAVHRLRRSGPGVKWHDYFAVGTRDPGGRRLQRRRPGRHRHLHPRRRPATSTSPCPPAPASAPGVKWHDNFAVRHRDPGGRRLQRRRPRRHRHLHPRQHRPTCTWRCPTAAASSARRLEVARLLRRRHRDARRSATSTATAATTSSTFTRGSTGRRLRRAVHRRPASCGTGWKWHDYFASAPRCPASATSTATAATTSSPSPAAAPADVYVALSTGARFVRHGWKWHDNFAALTSLPRPSLP